MTRYGLVLAGGASVRMGRAKQALQLDGVSLLQRTVDACLGAGGCDRVVVVAPDDACGQWFVPDERVVLTLEDPPLGGPVAGIAAGLVALGVGGAGLGAGGEVLLLACDLPRVRELVELLVAQPMGGGSDAGGSRGAGAVAESGAAARTGSASGGASGRALVPVDDEGWPQYLAARYPADSLLGAVDAADRTRDISVRRLLRGVEFSALAVPAELLGDMDSPEQARAAGIALE